MPRRLLLLAVLLSTGLLVGTPGAAAASHPDARSFRRATLAFDLARGKAIGRAERLGDARRRNAMACSETLRAAPDARRAELLRFYLTWVGAGYFTEDEPIARRWVHALERVSTSDAALRAARTSLRRQLARTRAAYGQGRRFCSPVVAWAADGWTAEARPTPLRRLRQLAAGARPSRLGAGVNAAARVLRARGGKGGELAADVLRDGIDEGDEIVIQRDDPIVALLDG